MIANDHPLVKVIRSTGRPIDNPNSHYKKRHEKEAKQKEDQEQKLAEAKQAYRALQKENKGK